MSEPSQIPTPKFRALVFNKYPQNQFDSLYKPEIAKYGIEVVRICDPDKKYPTSIQDIHIIIGMAGLVLSQDLKKIRKFARKNEVQYAELSIHKSEWGERLSRVLEKMKPAASSAQAMQPRLKLEPSSPVNQIISPSLSFLENRDQSELERKIMPVEQVPTSSNESKIPEQVSGKVIGTIGPAGPVVRIFKKEDLNSFLKEYMSLKDNDASDEECVRELGKFWTGRPLNHHLQIEAYIYRLKKNDSYPVFFQEWEAQRGGLERIKRVPTLEQNASRGRGRKTKTQRDDEIEYLALYEEENDKIIKKNKELEDELAIVKRKFADIGIESEALVKKLAETESRSIGGNGSLSKQAKEAILAIPQQIEIGIISKDDAIKMLIAFISKM